jgi:hypothetical protein
VGLLGPAALVGVGVMALVIAGIGALIVGIGALVDKFPQLETFLDKGIPILEKIGYAFGSFFGNIVGGFLGGMASGLPAIATALSDFMVNLNPFIAGARNIDPEVMKGIKSLAEAILILTAADILDGLFSFATGGTSLSEFGTELAGLGESLSTFAGSLDGFTEGDVEVIGLAADAIKKMAEAAAEIPNSGGWLGAIVGENSIAAFGEELKNVGTNLTTFAGSLEGFTAEDVEVTGLAAEAITKMAKAAKDIPNVGGIWALIFGDNGIGMFSKQMPQVGTNLKIFAQNLGTFSVAQVLTIGCAASAIKEMAKAASEIDGQADWARKLFGDNSIMTFSKEMPVVGNNLRMFAQNLGTFDLAKIATITCAVTAIKEMANIAKEIDGQTEFGKWLFGNNSISNFATEMSETGTALSTFAGCLGSFDNTSKDSILLAALTISEMAKAAKSIDGQAEWAKWLFGDNSLSKFGGEMEKTAEGIAGFADKLGTFDEAKVATIKCAVDAVQVMAGLSSTNLKDLGKNMPDFGDKLVDLATDLKTFCANMPSGGTMDGAVKNFQKVLDVINSVTASNASTAKDFADSLKTLGSDGVKAFVNQIKSSESLASAKAAGEKLMDSVTSGVKKQKKDLKTAFTDGLDSAIEAAKNKWQKFYDAGSYLVSGFATGISENTWKAEAKARAMAKAAAEAAEAELKINSPSKVFASIGSGVVEGFVKGIDDHQRDSLTSVNGMAKVATRGFSDAIRQVSDLLDGDMDIQPTIRPILDLSAVRSGAGSISSILNSRNTVGAVATAGVISTMMNERGQNGANYDVVSAIKDLRKDFDKLGTTSYNINGITYDDGTNMANAIATIVREARIERRR